MFGFQMVGSIAIDLAIDIYGTDHSKTQHPNTEHENVRFLNGFGFRMVSIRAPTVLALIASLRLVLTTTRRT